MGRVLIVNTLVESLYVYKLSVLSIFDEKLLGELQKEIINFIWKGKKPKIRYDMMISQKKSGGLRLVDMKAKHMALL